MRQKKTSAITRGIEMQKILYVSHHRPQNQVPWQNHGISVCSNFVPGAAITCVWTPPPCCTHTLAGYYY